MTREDVVELQHILIKEGLLSLDQQSGHFGAQTEETVKAYHRAHGLESVGVVGPLMRASQCWDHSDPAADFSDLLGDAGKRAARSII